MNDKILSLLGFAQKSRSLFSGENTVKLYIKKNRIKLVIIAEDTSQNSKEDFINLCNLKNIPYIIYSSRDELSKAIGKYNRAILGIKDSNFAEKILELYKAKFDM
ncbi:L7Ae/L30e/S12e/Gadd45 family ribosomal protein [Paramaledivibacter caminithermalis]|jgi:ribosomal protein L7Ae-like RNA K-turn-binding protein|uniref:Ribosomal protein L7Ae n=1 Tax=Paramaledivibacter caminithermalis (strain DSM 15212 / CIP 107654 / DViRD3) TaxID=1121301 RepID=A0A1M6N5D5_PARC5|nr:ribosomal L7Ae/L30e/S12e/Gadd45 family protein [Paramaledivibacter caminithermalis]SHJ90929.1 Ribosomal protein L7Ae [Paramaledivibacter caminithermalis DSM 15212]